MVSFRGVILLYTDILYTLLLPYTERSPQISLSTQLSVVIPTVNPGERLRELVSELLKCENKDFEVVINLNSPGSDFSFPNDERLKIFFEPVRIDVATNWTHAFQNSGGNYIWLIGDDDYILAGHISEMINIVSTSNSDCITFNGRSYLSPTALTKDRSLARDSHFNFGKSFNGILTSEQKEDAILNMYKFVPKSPLNLQLTIFSREVFNSIGGEFRMPFPDHIALMELLAVAGKWEIIDRRFCVIGMASSSFGHSAYSKHDRVGENYLGLGSSESNHASGNILNSVMLDWLRNLSNESPRFAKYKPSIGDFTLRQIGFNFRLWRSKEIELMVFLLSIKEIPIKQRIFAFLSGLKLRNLRLAIGILKKRPGVEKIIGAKFDIVEFTSIKEYADCVKGINF